MTVSLSDLMKELQAGEEARAKVPQLEASNKEIYRQFDAAQAHNQELELAIRGYKDTIDSLSSRIRSLEVERDDAGFRELEAIDKLNTVLDTMRDVSGMLSATITRVDPPKPEPIAQQTVPFTSVPVTEEPGVSQSTPPGVVPVSSDTSGERATDPTTTATQSEPSSASYSASGDATSGQSDANPSAPSTAPIQPSASGDAAEQSQPVPSPKTEEYRPFVGQYSGADASKPNAGRSYHEKPDVMSWSDWQASGGEKPYWL